MADDISFDDPSTIGNRPSVASAGPGSASGGGVCDVAVGGAEVRGQMFRSLADHSQEFIGMCDLEFKPFYVNQAGMTMVGLDSLEEACAVKVQDFFFPEDQRFIRGEFLPKVLREGRGEVEVRFRHFKTGAALWMIYNVFQVRDARGQASGYATVSRNITERKRTEEALRQSEAKYHSLFNSLDDGFCIIEVLFGGKGQAEDYRFLEVNDAFERHSGLQGAVGKRVREMVPDQDAHWFETYGRVALTGEPRRFATRDNALNRFFEVYAFRVGRPEERKVAVLFRDETQQKRVEDGLRKSEERLRLALEAGGFGTWDLDLITGRTVRSLRHDEIFGYAELQPEWSLEVALAHVLPEDRQKVLDAHTPALGRFKMSVETRLRRSDGSLGWILLTGRIQRNDQGRPIRIVGVCADITERKQAEESLRRSEVRQGYLLHLGDALRPLKDPVEIQEAAARVLGEHLGAERALYFEVRAPDYIVERDYARSVPPLRGRFQIAAFGPKLWEAYQVGRTVVVKDVQTAASLSPEERSAYAAIQIGAHVGVPLVKGGQLVAGLAVHAKARREWTAEEIELIEETAERTWAAVGRARAEEALRESEENYRTLFSSIDEGFCVIQLLFDEQGKPNDWRFVEVNPAFERHNGLEQATGKRIRELTPGIEAKWFEIYGTVALTGQAIRVEESSRALNRWFDLYAFPAGDPKDRKVAVLFTDITPRKRAEAELAQYREELERLVAERTARLQELVGELEHFSYTITHDLKAPLRAMRGFAEMAGEVCGQGEAKPFLEKIATAAERMDGLIRDALNYSQAVRQDLPLEDVDLGALLRGILDSYPQFQPWKAQIRVEGRLPVVLGNEAGLTQCFSNLLGNAVKFVKTGEKPEIRVWAAERGEWVRVWVEDRGIGISEAMLPRVFEMFSRGSKNYEGTGIGLALVRKVVQRMGGRVGVESEEGKGSRFWIELKSGEPRAALTPVTAQAPASAGEGTVLYVEDEESDAVFMERAFAQRGWKGKLQRVGTGRAAIEYLSGSGEFADRDKYPVPSVVLLDLNLPQVSGFGVLEWIRNHPDYARLPVVVFSSSTREDDRAKARELGADEFMTKPSSGLDFGKVVEELEGRGRLRFAG